MAIPGEASGLDKPSSRPRVLRWMVVVLAGCYLAAYVVVALLRLRYPFEVQWIEGASLLQVQRILLGQPLYVPPTVDYVPMVYNPLYYYLSALPARLLGNGFFPLRLVSFLASLGCFWLIYRQVEKEGRGKWAGFVAAGLFAATYGLTTGWFDVARVDTLFLFMALASLYLLRFAQSPLQLVIAGVVTAAAYFTKQSEITVILPLAVYAAIAHRWKAAYFIVTGVGLILLITLLFNHASHGWYNYYAITLPGQGHIDRIKWIRFWFGDLLPYMTVTFAAGGYFLLRGVDWVKERKTALYYLCATAGMFGAAWSGRLHTGGYINVDMPAYAWLCLLFGLEIGRRLSPGAFPAGKRVMSAGLLYILIILQFAALAYNPLKFLPSRADYRAGQALAGSIARTEGKVFIPFHPYLALYAGKQPSFHRMVYWEIDRGRNQALRSKLNGELYRAIREHEYSLIILDDNWLRPRVATSYQLEGRVFINRRVFQPRSGLKKRPEYIYRPKENPTAPRSKSVDAEL
jgi:hypothetical protein